MRKSKNGTVVLGKAANIKGVTIPAGSRVDAINGEDVSHCCLEDVERQAQCVPLPVVFSFVTCKPQKPQTKKHLLNALGLSSSPKKGVSGVLTEQTVHFSGRPFGLPLRLREEGGVCLKKAVRGRKGKISKGAHLISINNQDISRAGFEEIKRMCAYAELPAKMTFASC